MNHILKENYTGILQLAGVSLPCSFAFPETKEYFGQYCSDASYQSDGINISQSYWDYMIKHGSCKNSYNEFSFFSAIASDALLAYHRCVIHAVAFCYNNQAYLITAPPGVGKSTQIRYLQKTHPGEFPVISGDRPILERLPDQTILVHPSPWNGKEGWCGAASAPLAAVLCLTRGEKSSLRRLTARESVVPIYTSLISQHENESTVRHLSDMVECIINSVPVYEYINGGVPESTHFLYDSLFAKGSLCHAL